MLNNQKRAGETVSIQYYLEVMVLWMLVFVAIVSGFLNLDILFSSLPLHGGTSKFALCLQLDFLQGVRQHSRNQDN
jgi:hypothetical protein